MRSVKIFLFLPVIGVLCLCRPAALPAAEKSASKPDAQAKQMAHSWPQAAGPNGSWAVTTPDGRDAPLHWSVARDENIVWRTSLPEAGQSGIAVWGNRLFLTTMKPLPDASAKKEGHDVVGYCLDAKTGKILWTCDLPGSEDSTYAYGFSDSTTPSPITDGKHVWFFNASGSVGCYDYAGKSVWLHTWQPTGGRPFNKQFKPMLIGDTLLTMEPRDPTDPRREAKDPWNYVRGLDKNTGKTLWVSEDALTHYNTPVMGTAQDGTPALLMGRGGYHDVPEGPSGLSLVSLAPGQEGKTLWRYEAKGKALYNMHWDKQHAYWFNSDTGQHVVVDSTSAAKTDRWIKTQSLTDQVDYRRYDTQTGKYVLLRDADLQKLKPAVSVFPGWFTNILMGDWHYFLCFTDAKSHAGPPHCVGRVNIKTDRVEYLELPTFAAHDANMSGDLTKYIWDTPQSASTVNARGIDAAGDVRSKQDGWYWCMLPAPTAVNGKIFFSTMAGVTYVIDGTAKTLDEHALLAVNDVGPAGQTWSLNSISYAEGRLYHRSMKEVVCIGKK